jgi:DNA end-binding protein Ku
LGSHCERLRVPEGSVRALSDADFKRANLKASETIAIDTFCEAQDIRPRYYDTPYYLVPGKGGEKVYSLLRQALQATKKVAVATFVMRGRQHLCAVAPDGESLMLLTLRFSDELLPAAQAKTPNPARSISAAELAAAKKLIEEMSGTFKPGRFRDTYRADLKRRIQEKIRKKQWHTLDVEMPADTARPKAQVIDLMAALKASLKQRSASAARAAPKRATQGRMRA